MSDNKERHQQSIDLAAHFYDDFKALFEQAGAHNELDGKWFEIPLQEFDLWLVTQGVLSHPADDFDSNSVQRYGVVQHRSGARTKISAAARKATGHAPYSLSSRAKTGMLKVKLLELYARDAPADIAGGFRTSTAHYLRQVERIRKLANSSAAVSDTVRQRVNLCASVMEPLLTAFTWAGLNMQSELRQQDEGRALGLPAPRRPKSK